MKNPVDAGTLGTRDFGGGTAFCNSNRMAAVKMPGRDATGDLPGQWDKDTPYRNLPGHILVYRFLKGFAKKEAEGWQRYCHPHVYFYRYKAKCIIAYYRKSMQ